MRKGAFYNWDAAPKADSQLGYGVYDHAGIDPGKVPLPATNREASTALLAGQKKRKKEDKPMKKTASEAMTTGFSEEIQKLGFGMMAGGMGTPGAMGHGGVVTSKSKKSMGPKIKIISSKTRKNY